MSTAPPVGFLASRLDECILALTLLTRIPMPPARDGDSAALARAAWAYPLVGALVGAIGAIVFFLARSAGVPALGAAWLAIASTILATGCFHEDGLADFWDGIGGGHTVERKLEIMRDSRIGSYGAAALILSLGLRTSLVASLDAHALAEAALIATGLLGRAAIPAVLLALTPARTDGLAATAARPPRASAITGLAMATLTLIVLPPIAVWAAIVAALAAWLIMTRLIERQIGGYTGDALGATEQTVEMACLLAIAAAVG